MPEDRDQLFERALERHLRAAARREFLCPDAELLAAYQQKTLAQEEMAATESHIASCARCREILAQLEGSEGWKESLFLAAAAPAQAASIRKSRSWWTMVPAGAIAAGLLLWIGITVRHTRPQQGANPAAVADNRPELTARRDADDALQSAGSPKPEFREQAPAARTPPGPAARGNLREYSRRAAIPPPPGPAPVPAEAQPAAPVTGSSADSSGLSERAAGRATAQAESEALKTTPAPSPPAATAAARAAAPPEADSGSAARKAQKQAAPALLEKKDEAAREFSVPAGFNSVAARSVPVRVAAPGGRSIWSLGNNGQILYSKDAGRTWMRQFTELPAAVLTAGSAPSDEVCWVAGTAGTLLRTTDAGQHWQTVLTPIHDDLGGVDAADAQHASIWDLPHGTRYETSDGGVSWKPAGKE